MANGFPGVIVMDDEAFDEAVRVLQNPSPPTLSIVRGAEMLRRLYGQKRETGVPRDPDYDYTPPLPERSERQRPKGRQCGECGMKFDYGVAYGYCCMNSRCPTGWNRS